MVVLFCDYCVIGLINLNGRNDSMFLKQFEVDFKYIDFQGVVDGLYYLFYMEWMWYVFLKEVLGIDIEEVFW